MDSPANQPKHDFDLTASSGGQTNGIFDYGYHEQDERDALIFNLLLVNKWFLIPTSVAYQWLLSQNETARVNIYGPNTATILYISLSLLLIIVLWIAHNRIADDATDRRFFFSAQLITMISYSIDVLYIFYLSFNPTWGNLLWNILLLPLSFPLLAVYIRHFTHWFIDSIFTFAILILIFLSLQNYLTLTEYVRIPEGELLIILSGMLFLWLGLRMLRTWIDRIHEALRQEENRIQLCMDVLHHFPADFFLANERGEVLVASDGAYEYLDLPLESDPVWPPQTEAVRNALLLRFHAENPVDDPITVPDDARELPVKIYPSFFYRGNNRYCIALIQEANPEAGTQLGIMRSDRLAIAGQIAAGLAHEIGNPLGVIRSCADYMRQKAASDDPNKTEYELIESEAIRCQNLIDRLLSLASPKRDTPGIHDLRAILDHAISMVRYQAGTREIEQTFPEAPAYIYANEGQISAVFVNLLLNALQSMDESPEGFSVRVMLNIRGADAIVDVTDEGCGISSQELNRIFDPFFTKKASGTGLGLYIVHQIVTSIGGSIDAASKVGAGTTFTVRLPLYQGDIE